MADKVAIAHRWICRGYKVTQVVRIVGISRSCYYYYIKYRRQRVNFSGRPIPGYSLDRRGHRISDEQIKEWLCEAIEGDCYNYGHINSSIGYRPPLEYHNEIISKHENVLKISA